MSIVSRLAPTPSGHLHLGNLMNFTMTWALTRRSGGTLWLRFDDADTDRARPEYALGMVDTLQWLGLNWDRAMPSQQTRRLEYWEWLQHWKTYACDCSRKQLHDRGVTGLYDGHCRQRHLPFVPHKTQIRVRATDPSHDLVLWRKEDFPAYHLTSVVDDIRTGVNLIVRGDDLRESTQLQLELAAALGASGQVFKEARFIHHHLLLDDQGQKLAKSISSISLETLREQGLSPQEVFQLLAERAGWALRPQSIEDFKDFKFPEEERPN